MRAKELWSKEKKSYLKIMKRLISENEKLHSEYLLTDEMRNELLFMKNHEA